MVSPDVLNPAGDAPDSPRNLHSLMISGNLPGCDSNRCQTIFRHYELSGNESLLSQVPLSAPACASKGPSRLWQNHPDHYALVSVLPDPGLCISPSLIKRPSWPRWTHSCPGSDQFHIVSPLKGTLSLRKGPLGDHLLLPGAFHTHHTVSFSSCLERPARRASASKSLPRGSAVRQQRLKDA